MSWQPPTEHSALPRIYLSPHRSQDDALASGKRPSERPCILIVEDDFLVAMQIETALGEAGFDLAGIAATAEEAIAIAITTRPTLVVMDIRLAGRRDGIDAALELFRDHGLRCIFATAHRDPDALRRAAPARPLGWLQKPYSMDSLIELVRGGLNELKR